MDQYEQNIKQYKLSKDGALGIGIQGITNNDKLPEKLAVPHRDDHYLLLFAFEGDFHFKIDFEDILLSAPFILCIEPNQVHQTIKVINGEGWAVGVEEYMLENEFRVFLESRLSQPIDLNENDEVLRNLDTILVLIHKLQKKSNDVYIQKSVLFLLNSLFCLLYGTSEKEKERKGEKEKRGFIIEQSFKRLLKENFRTWKNPSKYASELSITVSHLNDTLKEITGHTLTAHIQKRNILEAKRLLYFTDFEVKEIAFKLGYEDPAYFGKFFKKITKRTPLEFRKQFRD